MVHGRPGPNKIGDILNAVCIEPQHIVIALQIQPKLRRRAEGPRQHERRTHGDGAFAVHDLPHSGFAWWHWWCWCGAHARDYMAARQNTLHA